MRKALFIFIFLQTSCICLGQFSIDLTGGLAEMRRDIPNGFPTNRGNMSLGLDLNYKFDSIPLEINITPYYMSSTVYEQFMGNNQSLSFYYPRVVVMSGAGTSFNFGKFVEVFTSLQLGYWYTKSTHSLEFYSYPYGEESEKFERKYSQFAIGPKLGVRLGKKKFKVIIQYEDYFFSASPGSRFGKERYTRFSVGLSYLFIK